MASKSFKASIQTDESWDNAESGWIYELIRLENLGIDRLIVNGAEIDAKHYSLDKKKGLIKWNLGDPPEKITVFFTHETAMIRPTKTGSLITFVFALATFALGFGLRPVLEPKGENGKNVKNRKNSKILIEIKNYKILN